VRGAIAAALVAMLGGPASADTNDAARMLLDSGVEKFNAGSYVEARTIFEHARELAPDKANPYRWLGLTDARLGRCEEAVAELDKFLAMVPASDGRVREASLARDLCKRQLEASHPPPPPAPVHEAPPPEPTPAVTPSPPVVEPAPAVAAPSVATAPPPHKKRPYWIIGVAVGGAVVVAGAIVLGVVLSGSNTPGSPPTPTFGSIPLQ
jgi:tetratricopeptide (TPR) repeat protein